MRTVTSQDGKMIVNIDRIESIGITRHSGFEDGKEYECFYVTAHKVGDLGKYSTEKRALLVLDMLNEWLKQSTITTHQFESYAKAIEVAAKYGQYFQTSFNVIESACFVMPQDSEELDA